MGALVAFGTLFGEVPEPGTGGSLAVSEQYFRHLLNNTSSRIATTAADDMRVS